MRYTGLVVLLVVLAGCSDAAREARLSESEAERLAREGQTRAASEMYSRMGEMLMVPEGLDYARQMFEQSLRLNAKNSRAHFYLAVLKPILQFRGLVPRFQNVLPKKKDWLLRIGEVARQAQQPEYRDFILKLPAGKPAIRSIHGAQGFLRTELLAALLEGQRHIAQINLPLELRFHNGRFNELRARNHMMTHGLCWKKGGWICDASMEVPGTHFHQLDQVDLTVLGDVYAGLIDRVRITTAYSLEGYESFRDRLDFMHRYLSVNLQDLAELVREYPRLFTLVQGHELAKVPGSARLLLERGISLARMRNEICRNDKRSRSYVLVRSICVTEKMVDQMTLAIGMLAGPKVVETRYQNARGERIKIKVHLRAVFENPVADLKSLLPRQFDRFGKPLSFPDHTLGGLFPDADFLTKLVLEVPHWPSVKWKLRSSVKDLLEPLVPYQPYGPEYEYRIR